VRVEHDVSGDDSVLLIDCSGAYIGCSEGNRCERVHDYSKINDALVFCDAIAKSFEAFLRRRLRPISDLSDSGDSECDRDGWESSDIDQDTIFALDCEYGARFE
jgi:hypothetical protein